MRDWAPQMRAEMIGATLLAWLDSRAMTRGRPMHAEVFSVHEHAVNLIPFGDNPGAGLLSIVTDRSSSTRNSLVLPSDGPDLATGGFVRGERVAFEFTHSPGLALQISTVSGAAPPRPLLRVNGEPMSYSGRIEAAGETFMTSKPRDRLRAMGHLILDVEDGTGFGGLARVALGRLIGKPVGDQPLANPFATHAAKLLLPALEGTTPLHELLPSLVGLGIGFTPSGDDFIAGALAACSLIGARLPRASRDALLARSSTATTLPGSVLVSDAMDGSFPGYLRDFALCVAGDSRTGIADLEAAVARAAKHGYSSGVDATTGFLLALTLTQT